MEKLIKRSNKETEKTECFVKIYKSKTGKYTCLHGGFNMCASELIGRDTENVDMFFDGKNVFVIPNKDGSYKLTWKENRKHCKVSFKSLINNIGMVDVSKRYNVETYENGIMFCLEKER